MKHLFYLVFVLFFVACGESQKTPDQVVEKSGKNTLKKHDQILTVSKEFRSEVDDWSEYDALNNFIQQYTSISPNEALNNSRELNGLTKSLNDSIKPDFLSTSAFNARVNFMYNETLRLHDMSSISAIKSEEVNNQVDKILMAYSSINSKINTTLLQSKLDSEVSDMDFNKTIDSSLTSKASTSKKKKVKQLSKKEQKMKLTKEDRLKKRKAKLKIISSKTKDEKKN